MKKLLLQTTVLCFVLCGPSVQAATKYWDINGATAGSGQGIAAGTWNTSGTTWSTDSAGGLATVAFASGDAAVFSAGTDGTSAWTVTLPSALTAGSVTVEEGTVTKSGAALTVQTITINSGATLSYNSSGGIVASAGGTLTLNGTGATFGYTAGGGGGTFLTTSMGIVLNGGGTLSDALGSPNIYSGVISGTGDLTKTGAGVLAITTTCTYSGSTRVNNGVLRLRTGTPQIPNTDLIVTSPGGFDAATFNQTVQSLSGTGSLPFSGAGTLTIAGSSSTTFSGAVTGAGVVTKAGAGTLTIQTTEWANTGGVNINAGTIKFGNSAAGFSSSSTVTVASSAFLDMNSINDTFGALAGAGSVINNSGTTGLRAGANNASTTFSGVISGTGNFEKQGTGTLTLTGNNNYAGNTTLTAGGVSINGVVITPFGNGAGTINLAGGNIVISANRGTTVNNIVNPLSLTVSSQFQSAGTTGTRNLVFGGPLTGSAGTLTIHETGTGAGPATFSVRFTNAFSFSRPITFAVDTAGHSVNLDIWNRADLGDQTYSGLITGPGAITRSITTANTGGKVTFTAQNTFSGGTSLNDGEIALASDCTGAADAPTAGPLGTGTVTMGNDGGKLSASGASRNLFNHMLFTVGGTHLTFLGANDLELSGNVDLAAQAVTLTNNNSGVCKLSGVISNGSLTKAGAGKLTLTGANTYVGTTTVTEGTLLVNGSTAAGSVVTVETGATLAGTGAVNGTVDVQAGGTLAPGASIGTLTVGGVTMGGATLMEINSSTLPNADKVSVISPLTYDGALTVLNIGPALVGGESFDLFDAPSFSGSFATTSLPALGTGLNWWTGSLVVDGTLIVNRAPTATDKTYTRNKSASLKIPKADLLVGASDVDAGDSVSYDALPGTGTQGAAVTEDATYVYYEPVNDNADTLQYRLKDTQGGTVTKNIQINVVASTGQAQSIVVSGSTATVSFAGIPGTGYLVQRSTNLVDWVTIETTNAPANGLFDYTDNFSDLGVPPDPVPSAAYYRLSQP